MPTTRDAETGVDTSPRTPHLDRAYRICRAIRAITVSLREAMQAHDYARCVVELQRRQDYIGQMVQLGHRLSSACDGAAAGDTARRDAIRRIQEIIARIMALDKESLQYLYTERDRLIRGMQEVANARRFAREYGRIAPSPPRFVDLMES